MLFDKRVTLVKRNHIYLGPTQSCKLRSTLEEIKVDLNTIFHYFNVKKQDMSDMVDLYVGDEGRLSELSSQVSEMENTLEMLVYIRGTQ